jgi:TP901 family phage tail tape measure protein
MKKFVIPSVFTAVDKLSGPVSKMGKSVQDFATESQDAVARSNRRFRKLGDTAFDVAGKSALIGTAIIAPLGLAAKAAIDFEDKMSNVSTLIDPTRESMEKMGQELLSIAKKVPVPIEELTTSLYDIRSAGISADMAMSTLSESAKLSKAGLSTASEATNIMTSALNAFKSEGLTALETSDILFKTVKAGKTTISELAMSFGATAPIVQSAGVSLADFQAATAALTTVGTPASVAQNQLRASIVALQKPTKEMESIFKSLGVTTEKELIEKFGGLGGSFEAINKTGAELGLNLSKAWSSVEAFAAVTSITGSTNKSYTDTLYDMANGANAVNDAFDKQANTTAAKIQLAQNNMLAFSIAVGTAVLPIITKLVDKLTPLIDRITVWISENKELVKLLVKIAAVLAAVSFAISGVAFTVGIYSKAMLIAAAASKAWAKTEEFRNAVMSLSPVQKMITLVGLLGAYYVMTMDKTQRLTEKQKALNDIQASVIEKTANQRSEINKLFSALIQAEKGSTQFNEILNKIDQIQPGITQKYNLQEKSIKNLKLAYDELIKSIEEKARVEAASELYTQAVKDRMLLEQQSKEKQGQGMFSQFVQGFYDYDNTLDRVNERLSEMKMREQALFEQVVSNEIRPAINQPKSDMDSQTEKIISGQMKSSVDLNLNDSRLSVANVSPNVNVRTSSTK